MNDTISVEDLRDYFECPVCFCIPTAPPIFQCGKGHLICATCRPKVTLCPICRTRMPNDCRLLFAERLLEERLPISCRYSDDGCSVQMVSNQIRAHETSCPFAPVPCRNSGFGCRATPMAKQMAEHLQKCDYRIVPCPILSCQEEVLFKQVEAHLTQRHFAGQRWLNFNAKIFLALLAICLISIFVNFILLTSM